MVSLQEEVDSAMNATFQSRDTRVVIAGQIPPPIGGQNICIRRTLDLLIATKEVHCEHLAFEFTKTWGSARRLGGGKLLELIKVIARLLRLRSAGRIDVLIYPAGGPHLVAILRDMILLPFVRICSKRVLLHFHAAGLAEYLAANGAWQRKLIKLIYRGCCHDAIVNARFGRSDALAAGIREIHILPNGVDDHAGGSLIRDARGECEILNVGHLCRDKGTPQLLESFARIAPHCPELRLKLVGEALPPYSREELLADIERTGYRDRINWTGVLEGNALQEAFRDADLFVFSSIAPYESFGLVMVEAMQWSLPLVITDWRANREVCGDHFGGVIAIGPEGDLTSSLEGALNRAFSMRSDWPKWGGMNREIFEKNYSVNVFRSRLLEILKVHETPELQPTLMQ